MNAEDIIREIQKNAQEWLEMTDAPDKFLVGVLANKVSHLMGEVEYLKKRLDYERRQKEAKI